MLSNLLRHTTRVASSSSTPMINTPTNKHLERVRSAANLLEAPNEEFSRMIGKSASKYSTADKELQGDILSLSHKKG